MSVSNEKPAGQIIVYQAEDGHCAIRVRLQDDTVWMTQNLMAELYQTTQQNISLHVRNIFEKRVTGGFSCNGSGFAGGRCYGRGGTCHGGGRTFA